MMWILVLGLCVHQPCNLRDTYTLAIKAFQLATLDECRRVAADSTVLPGGRFFCIQLASPAVAVAGKSS